MKSEKYENPLEANIVRTGMSWFLNKNAKIIMGGSAKGKSYAPFFVKHNLMGETNEKIKFRLQEIIADENFQEPEREQAKRILQHLDYK